MGEEGPDDGLAAIGQSGHRWLVDPLDGTVNYVHRLPNFAVSVAVESRGEVLAGAVYDPSNEECFTATRGRGAWRNGERVYASGCTRVDQALVAASFSANVARDSVEIQQFIEMLLAAQSVRRLGSAALNLCYVGCGRLDGYWASSVKTWDVAAGTLVVAEAGGVITSLDGAPLNLRQPKLLAAATAALHGEMLRTLEKR